MPSNCAYRHRDFVLSRNWSPLQAEPDGPRRCAASPYARACLERAWGCQAADGGLAHAIGAGQIGLHSAFRESLDGFFPLVRGQLYRAPKFHATRLRSVHYAPGITRIRVGALQRPIAGYHPGVNSAATIAGFIVHFCGRAIDLSELTTAYEDAMAADGNQCPQ
jgi:hypothetical protein